VEYLEDRLTPSPWHGLSADMLGTLPPAADGSFAAVRGIEKPVTVVSGDSADAQPVGVAPPRDKPALDNPPAGHRDMLSTVLWAGTDEYITQLTNAFVAEGRIGNPVTGGGPFELDLGATPSAPAVMADYKWTQSDTGHPFILNYNGTTGVATFINGPFLQYQVEIPPDTLDSIFIRTFALKNNSGIAIGGLELYSPAFGSYVPVPMPDGSGDPAVVSAAGPSDKNTLQIMGADLHNGFTLAGTSYWVYATSGSDAPAQSQLAFQIMTGV